MLTIAPGSAVINGIGVDIFHEDKTTAIYCATNTGVYRSLGDGSNWEYANNGLTANPPIIPSQLIRMVMWLLPSRQRFIIARTRGTAG